MSKIFRAATPLTSRIAPVLGAVLVLIGLMASSQLHLAQVTAGSTVTTDKSDYVPGETVVISGSGWIPGQPVALHIDESDNDLPWDVSATPDAAGNFSNSEFVVQAHDIGVVFTLTATQGGVVATTQFTDVVGAGIAPNGDPGGFEIQGGVVATAGGGHTDWIANGVGTTGLLTSAGVPIDPTVTYRRLDAYNLGDDVFSGSHTFNDNPNTYTWKTASAGNKSDLNNVYVHISKDSSGDRWVTASADRLSNNGTAFVDFELNQAGLTQVTDVGCSSAPCGHFETNPAGAVSGDPLFATGGRTPNDLLITAQYNSGGALASAIVYQWKLVSGTYQWFDITSSIGVNTAFVATNTVDGVSVPYGAFGATTYSKNQFVEMSIDATKLIQAVVDPCSGIEVHSVFVRTKTSTTATSVLDDFVTPIATSFSAGFTASLTQSVVSCFGGSNGSVTATINGGTPPYSVTLDATTQTVLTDGGSTTFTGLSAGTKTVHVVATGGCTKDAMINVTQPASAVGSSITSQTNVGCLGGSTGSVTVAGSGGTPSYTYSIDGTNFGVSGTFNNLAAGPYTVTVKDAHGCTTTQPVTITQPASGVSASISSQTNVACFGASTGSVTVSASGGTSPYTFSKDGVTFGASGTFSNLAAGSYTVTVKDANGCTTTQPVTITQPAAAVSASISSQTNVACFGGSTGSVTVAGSGGTGSYTFSKDGVNFGGSGTFGSLAAGSYTITVKDANGCTTTQPVTITQSAAALGASISSQTNVACFGSSTGSVTIAGSGGTAPYTYAIDGVTFGNSGTFNNLAPGSYTVTVKDANGCTTTQGVTITQPASALGSSISSQTNVACFGNSTGSVTVAGSGGTAPYSYAIDGTTFGASGTFSNLAAGGYTITVKDANGCTTTQPVTITQPAAALGSSISSQTNVACFGGSTGSVTVAGSGGTSPYTFSKDGVNFGASGTFGSLAAGSYTITVKDANGCSTTQPVTITEPASALGSSISSQTNVDCFGGSTGSVTVAGSGGTSPYTYAIDGTTFGNSGTFGSLAAGSYTITVKDANGCTTTQPVTITQPAAALSSSISSQTNVACFGSSTGSVTVSASGGTTPYTYSIDGTNFGNSGTFSNLAAGSYTITVKDANGCTTTQPVTITQPASGLIASALATNPACSTGTGSITVTASGGTGTLSYSIDGTNFQASNVFNGLASGSYTITVKDANGCTTAAGATVTIPTPVTASSTKTDPLCNGQLGSMTATFSGGTLGYECSLDNGSFAPCTSPATFNNLGAGSHTVAVRDSNACLGPSQTQMIVIPTAINASITTTPASSSIAADGTMTVTVNGGTPGYSVTLNGGAPHTIAASGGSTTFTGLTSGGYNVVITDANGCSLGIAEQLGVAPATTEVRLCTILSSLGTGGKTVFMVTLPKGPLKQPLTVFYTMSGTAIFGADYSLSPIVGQFTIPAGKTSATVTITALKNLARKTNRNATMTIINGPAYFCTAPFNTATVVIRR